MPQSRRRSAARAVHVACGLAALALLLAGCGGDSSMPGQSGGTITTPVTPEPTYSYVQTYVFSAICTGCHIGAVPPAGLDLTPSKAPGIVGRASTEVPALALIAPGDPANSYLILKVQGAPGIAFERMPYGGPYLDPTVIQAMVDWVSAGAPIP